MVGGSLTLNNTEKLITKLKQQTQIPVILFPGNAMQFTPKADAILFMSLLSGRNPEFLISNQVITAPAIKRSGIQSISTAYILIDGGKKTSVEYISNTQAIPADKHEITLATCMAAELLGFKLIYLEAGSGAKNTVPEALIKIVKSNINLPLIVGGGIRNTEKAQKLYYAGADILVIGSKTEETPGFIDDLCKIRNDFNR